MIHFDSLEKLKGIFDEIELEAQQKLQKEIDGLKSITCWIEDNHSAIIKNIEQESIDVYNFLKKEFNNPKAHENYLFQFVFRSFYRIDNAGLTPEFKKEFFNILEEYRKDIDLDYEEVLRKLYAFPNLRDRNTLQFSFVTKMFNTIDDSMPIYDSKVAKMFSLSRPYQTDFEVKLDKYLHQLYKIERGYKLMLEHNLLPKTLCAFDEKFTNNELSKMKKMDFIFWSAGKLKSRMAERKK